MSSKSIAGISAACQIVQSSRPIVRQYLHCGWPGQSLCTYVKNYVRLQPSRVPCPLATLKCSLYAAVSPQVQGVQDYPTWAPFGSVNILVSVLVVYCQMP